MTYHDWTQLNDSQRSEVIKTWDVYSEGYWHDLNNEAVRDFSRKYSGDTRIREVTGGLYHGGHLIVAVCKTIPWDEMLDLPKYYFGFRVIQMGTESKKDVRHPDDIEL